MSNSFRIDNNMMGLTTSSVGYDIIDDILLGGKTNRVVCYQQGRFVDYDIEEALNMTKTIDEYEWEVAHLL